MELSTTGHIIKPAYESQPNTNAFTDAEKAKLAQALITAQRAAANGVASLDATGKVPASQLNVSGLSFKGAWNASTNTPALVDGTGTTGDFYKCGTAGTFNFGNGSQTFFVGDWVMFAAGVWQRLGSSDAVASVNGKLGEVILTAGDVGALPDTYVPPAQQPVSWPDILDRPIIPAAYVHPKLAYTDTLATRVANTWYTNAGALDKIVNITTNYIESSASSFIEMRAPGTTTPVFRARGAAVGTGNSNQAMQGIVPSGWQYRFVPGAAGRSASAWFEGDYS